VSAPKIPTRLLAGIAGTYDRRLRQCGLSAKGAFWRNEEMQLRRYQILCQIFDEADQAGGLTIHDFGCGYGALFHYLEDLPVMQHSQYIGTDMSKEMIDAAQGSITDPRARFVRHVKSVEIADYTFVCGTFNMHLDSDPFEWAAYVKDSLVQLWSKTRKGLAFNMLHPDSAEIFDTLFYADPQEFFTFCSTRLSSDVSYRTDEPLPDWTMFVRR